MEVLLFHRNVEDNLVGMGVLGLWPWVVTGERLLELSEEVPKRLVGAVRQLLLGWVGEPRRQLPGQLWAKLLIFHGP